MRRFVTVATALLLAATALAPSAARELAIPAHGVIGIEDAQLDPAYWVRRLPDADRIVLDSSPAVQACRRMGLTADYLYS